MYASLGMTKEQVALRLGFSYVTLSRYQKKDARFKQAIEEGLAMAISSNTMALKKLADKGNVAAVIFFLKARAGWKETQIIEQRELVPIPEESQCTQQDAENAYMSRMQRGLE